MATSETARIVCSNTRGKVEPLSLHTALPRWEGIRHRESCIWKPVDPATVLLVVRDCFTYCQHLALSACHWIRWGYCFQRLGVAARVCIPAHLATALGKIMQCGLLLSAALRNGYCDCVLDKG
jgi:hypothetical protein